MSLVLAKHLSLAEFLDWEGRQDLRYEFDGVQAVAMTGGTAAHAAIQRNLALTFGSRLRGKPCQYYGSELKIEVAGRIRYPDGFVVCSPVHKDAVLVRDPVVIFEVLSDSTEWADLVKKNREYGLTQSVRRYLALSQKEMAGTMFERIAGEWMGRIFVGETLLQFPEIGIEVPLSEIYEGLDIAAEAEVRSEPSP